ncbi:MAG: phosphate acyltransferase PlsX [Acidobacteriota bacterium]|nr:phosphate acyltransferase PlsX [Acidobacteriota bacterium]
MHIAVDAMGGDHAPAAVVAGAYDAAVKDGVQVLLVGRRKDVERQLKRVGKPSHLIEIVNAEQVVGMDEPAITPIRRKRDSSIRVCCELVRAGNAEAMVSFGNTGAALTAAKMVIGVTRGVERPALAAVFPSKGGRTIVLDVGANVRTKPEQLRQFAVMGHFYAQEVLGDPAPRIGLLSIGEEEAKGNEATKQGFKVLQETGLNFIGNVEGRDVFEGSVDVVVCDGFVGNVLLKSAESMAALIASMLREELSASWRTRLGFLLAQPGLERLKRRTDYQETGAVPLLGLEGGCFIGHGRSQGKAVRNAIRQAVDYCDAGLLRKIRSKVAELHEQEERLLGAGAVREAPVA